MHSDAWRMKCILPWRDKPVSCLMVKTALAQLLRQYNIVSLLTKEKKCLRNCSTTF